MKSNVYTATGDKGTTSLVGGERVKKNDIRLDAYGTIDELSSVIGAVVASDGIDPESREFMLWIQNKLFVIGSYLATDKNSTQLRDASRMSASDVEHIESTIDTLDEQLPKINNFILPGGTFTAALANMARTVARRAERRILDLNDEYPNEPIDENILKFINRLSDYFFIFARFNNVKSGKGEIFWSK